ncbi:MAG: glutamine--fructose-6-phosphate aminotransferase [Candidatus Magasanikbacteria bacterium RIFCSPHIGHO2_01_FULL_41_23]|uniref:Glutamine--fructose-6-phosphate aminotransferase [isomerizing] n=1 Tax=Candidatus Magasanikbacteria bacterium RIFCSPLOWO2_01_FULL_40_15 TaxID=1798686 RepID=A0A1F6N509_9BACT|nr:MAG: glutamine--fructose-6-phosphate aminotransferase [Candidatus Magasanikbacteria bacterium RIFCSPHIGHO2_01_FULL_41_23]OGH67207.1 MAG: glutamine--fructose-6-phosphate aminotransferase [Candidatus Magasanikbacteria bacterium RIFCSPHIGHO2_02_FULL_41_35]OGH75427.1 MAG: glutamine--fructose-6-phosphate aminotransferase [Candidatus Magasanikbacteria bacterium RIFCSPHIGHO2_12_FULL_41_16]OGH78743.1 MAG: glutamine--fructose-6-phosphate aminotransferase [Candidatus Magasanikbacteria bacterium RIFCSPL
MCGIIAYIGKEPALPILLRGLRRLEYRGYDSAGVAILNNGGLNRVKTMGKIDILSEKLKDQELLGTMGIAHTRWATHGGVTEANAHPHSALNGKLMIVHNGIIENYRELKNQLLDVSFVSQTDTEVLVHLIGKYYSGDLRQAVETALAQVRGTYGLVVTHADHPDKLIAARMGSPLVIGVGENEHYIASDATPILAYTNQVVFLDDGEIAEVSRETIKTFNVRHEHIQKRVEKIDWDEAQAEKQGFAHFMLKEIYDQPTVFQDAIRGRYNIIDGTARLGGINLTDNQIRDINRVIFIGCGTTSYAAMAGKYAFERLAGIPAEVDVASEFRYRDPVIDNHTLVFAISQSGETADTLAAVREAKRRGAVVRGIVNAVGSTIARETDGGTYIHAGPELAVASTKAYTNMIAVLILYALQFGRLRRLSLATGLRVVDALREVAQKMKETLELSEEIKKVAQKYSDYHNMMFLGRGINFSVALEGSLKLKEISYIHSEAFPGGEMKHGPLALLCPEFPVFAIMTKNQLYEKMRSNVEEVRARGAKVILLATKGDDRALELADDVIYVPETMELLEPLINTIPLQLFAYHMAVILGKDVDRPRNLAKSVTVE